MFIRLPSSFARGFPIEYTLQLFFCVFLSIRLFPRSVHPDGRCALFHCLYQSHLWWTQSDNAWSTVDHVRRLPISNITVSKHLLANLNSIDGCFYSLWWKISMEWFFLPIPFLYLSGQLVLPSTWFILFKTISCLGVKLSQYWCFSLIIIMENAMHVVYLCILLSQWKAILVPVRLRTHVRPSYHLQYWDWRTLYFGSKKINVILIGKNLKIFLGKKFFEDHKKIILWHT